MKTGLGRLSAIGVAFLLGAGLAAGQSDSVDAAEGWVRSAISRGDNANALEADATALMQSAAGFRERECLYEAEKRSNLKRAGEAEFRAGELGVAAANHYAKASENWSNAANVYAALGNADQQSNAETMVASSRQAAKRALTQAVGRFESAAEAFSEFQAAEPEKKIAAQNQAEEARRSLAALL